VAQPTHQLAVLRPGTRFGIPPGGNPWPGKFIATGTVLGPGKHGGVVVKVAQISDGRDRGSRVVEYSKLQTVTVLEGGVSAL